MKNQKGNEYGQVPLYELGDRVRVWKVFKNPVGTVERVVSPETFPIKYSVRYQYHEGGWYTETFDECDLTLVERVGSWYCNCKTASDKHTTWCNRYNSFTR